MATGYCTLEDLRRALQEAELPGDISQDEQIAIDAINAQTEWLEKTLKRHWYEPGGIDEATAIDIPTSAKTRDDEEDIPTSSAFVVDDDGPAPKTWHQDYTRIRLARRDAVTVEELLIYDGETYVDWVESDEYGGSVYGGSSYGGSSDSWPEALGDDYYIRVNNGGWSELYLDTSNLLENGEDDEYVLETWSNAVYVTFAYGHEGIPQNVRRAVALRAASYFVDEAAMQIPESSRIRSVESKADQMERKAEELLEVYQ